MATAALYAAKNLLKRLATDTAQVSENDLAKLAALLEEADDEQAERADDHHRSLVDTHPDPIAVGGPDGAIVYANEHAARLCGADSPEELRGRHLLSFIHADDLNLARRRLKAVLGGETSKLTDMRLVRLDGEVRVIEVSSAPVLYEGLRSLQTVFRDVTERRRQARELEEAHNTLLTIAEHIPGGVFQFEIDSEGVASFPYISAGIEQLWGMDAEEARRDADAAIGLVHESDRDEFLDSIDRSAREMKPWSWEGRMRVNGQIRWVHCGSRPAATPDGGVRWNGLIMDVTCQKQGEIALAEERAFTEKSLDTLSDIFYVIGPDGRFLRWNRRLEKATGCTPGELRHMGPVDFCHPDDAENVRSKMEKVLKDGKSVTQEADLVTKDGRRVAYEWSTSGLRDATGQMILVGTGRDVTEQKKSEAAVRASEKRYRALMEQAGDAIFVADADTGMIVDANRRAQELVGYSLEELRQMHQVQIHPPECRQEYGRLFRTQQRDATEIRDVQVHHRDGFTISVNVSASVVDVGGKRLVNGIFHDVTEIREAERQLREALGRAEAAAEAKAIFLAKMSHEIRTPMNGVIGMADLLLGTPLSPSQRRYAEAITNSGDSLLRLIDDILDFSKIEAGKLSLERVPLDPAEIAREVVELFTPRAAEKGISMRAAIASGLPSLVVGDPHRLRQVITNLVSNAVKFTEEGEVVIRLDGAVAREGHARIKYEVSDTGIGISEAAIADLFTAFTQADDSTTRRFGGTGLGLAISRQIVEMMGGTIRIESEKGTGTTFHVELELEVAAPPAQKSTSESRPAPKSEEVSHVPARPRLRVLLAEDNTTNQIVARTMLEQLGCTVDLAVDGREAVEAVERSSYDLIFMDCQMPVIDGYRATELIRRQEQGGWRTPIVALTAYAMPNDRRACLDAGMDGYLQKPFRKAELHDVLIQHAGDHGDGAVCPAADPSTKRSTEMDQVLATLDDLVGLDEVDSVREVTGTFVESLSTLIAEARAAVEAADWAELSDKAHTMKGATLMVGAQNLGALCLQLEELSISTAAEPSMTLLRQIEDAHTALREEFARRELLSATC